MFCFSTLCPHQNPTTSLNSDWKCQLIESVYQTASIRVWLIATWFFERELEGECRLVKTADLSLNAVWAEWVISVWPPLLLEEGMCTALSKTQPKVFEETFLLTLHQELSSGNIDIPLQILKWQLPLLSKVKLIRSSWPTGCCLVYISTAWSPAQVSAAASKSKYESAFFFFFFLSKYVT